MTVDTTSYYDSLLASSSTSTIEYTSAEEATSLTSEDFLTLLVTELQYQDPTDPMDNVEMVNQLTQYSQLDELASLNEKIESFSDTLDAMSAVSGLDYLGMEIEASGYTVTKDGDDVSSIYYTLEEDAASLTVNVYDSNGNIVDTATATDVEAGTYVFAWDGYDYTGSETDDGTYSILFSAENDDGDSFDVSTTTTGTVTGVSTTDDGVILTLSDGRTVNMVDVTYATN
ncbi:flagellar hook assembly protein FlgD [Pseudodesulfovibrio portus]|uniref:Basal-body rod modification protein FlgD n=1 Tax=Pseudodesulfovibrio portus TaxID=231439 RepID=A0ABM8AVI4_9BACT|nr:flagellar hook capping FlgD N-terminal domain-containing protein [Pseudodesulfovibrio portus]BDQ35508.1 basal-body rod modification protein FlgD [Pseudodesulfovibrio portus]